MLRCQQVNRNEIWIRISVCVEIDGRFDAGPFCLGYRRINMQEIIESQTGPPCDCAPTFDANQPRNLLMHREASQEIPNIERDAQGRSEPIQSQFPSRNIAGIWSRSVVVVLERGNLRFGVGGHPASSRVKCLCNVIVDTQCFVKKPLLPWRVHVSRHTRVTERILRQEKSSACKRCE